MSAFSWLRGRHRGAGHRRNSSIQPPHRFQLRIEDLEERAVPTWTCASPDPTICAPLSTEGTALHFHPHLTIIVNGQQQVIPANIGITLDSNNQPSQFQPIHTHTNSGLIHIESPTVRTYHLSDFFNTWGQPFDATHILGYQTSTPITMTVRPLTNPSAQPQPSTLYGNLVLMDEGQYNGVAIPSEDLSPGLEVGDDIVITATNATSALGAQLFAAGGNGHVQVRRVGDGALLVDFTPFGSSFTGGISVAAADINKDGFKDLVVSQTSGSAMVKVYNGQGLSNGLIDQSNMDAGALISFAALDASFHVGVNVATGDVNGDTFPDIVTGAVAGNPDIRVFSGKDIAQGHFNANGSSKLAQFFAYGLQFNVGANVAAGDLSHNGFADIVTGATAGNPDVHVYSGKDIAQGTFNPTGASLLDQFFAYGLQFNVGATVAVGDVNGDGFADLITGATAGNPHVKVYDGRAVANGTLNRYNPDASLMNSFFAYDLQFNVGVNVAAADFEGTGSFDILTGATVGSPHYRVVKGTTNNATKPPAVHGLEWIPTDITGGIHVGA